MQQIYYTQCPVGYGLGASNGFQIKRLSPGYPTSGDFRHLGLRAFPGGSRILAPPALRYRRDGDVAEVAWLTPRPNEYETERGLWGRPGGHFAHGIRLDAAEFAAIRRWPAGLFDGSVWRRSDREPTRGRPPEGVDWSTALSRPPSFTDVAPLAEGEDPERLAELLTAVALAARKGQTLFLIDEPSRLGPRIAMLTFAIPEAFRGELTFSTYHDRPEELPGYRIQGTTAAARPNRAALTALGIVVDAIAGTTEPRVEPAAWARTLAGWLIRRGPIDEADWSETATRAREARRPEPPDSVWDDAWLDALFFFPEARRSRAAPTDGPGWSALADFANWLGRTGLARDWLRSRDAAWWLASASPEPEARAAFVAHATLPEAWAAESEAATWGEALAAWTRDADPADRDGAVAAVLRAAPRKARPTFARSLLKGLSPAGAAAVLDRLRADRTCDRGTLLPLEAGAAAAEVLDGGGTLKLSAIVEDARTLDGATSAVLDAVESAVERRTESLPLLADAVASAFDLGGPGGGREGLAWALRRGKNASAWLGPSLQPILVDADRLEVWKSLPGRVPEAFRGALARAVLEIARDSRLPDEAFRWGVEGLLMPLAPRPHDPTWAETYLERTPSDLDLIRRLFSAESRKLGVPAWIEQARSRNEVSPAQSARIENCRAFARSLKEGDPASLLAVPVPDVPSGERAALLNQMLFKLGGQGLEGLPYILKACKGAWLAAFDPGAEGLRVLAVPLAQFLAKVPRSPDDWLAQVSKMVDHLGLTGSAFRGFEPDGLAAEMAAATASLGGRDPWPLRQLLLLDDAWRILATDLRRELGEAPPSSAAQIVDRWDGKLQKGDRLTRFWELALNAPDGRRLVAIVSERTRDLKSLPASPPMTWWGDPIEEGRPGGLRERFAREVPLDPFPPGRLPNLVDWMGGRDGTGLSDRGVARWRSLVALTEFRNACLHNEDPWPMIEGWRATLPMAALVPADRYRLVAWLIVWLPGADRDRLGELAGWLRKSGMKDPARLSRWLEELGDAVELDADGRRSKARLAEELRSCLYRILLAEQEGRASAGGRD